MISTMQECSEAACVLTVWRYRLHQLCAVRSAYRLCCSKLGRLLTIDDKSSSANANISRHIHTVRWDYWWSFLWQTLHSTQELFLWLNQCPLRLVVLGGESLARSRSRRRRLLVIETLAVNSCTSCCPCWLSVCDAHNLHQSDSLSASNTLRWCGKPTIRPTHGNDIF